MNMRSIFNLVAGTAFATSMSLLTVPADAVAAEAYQEGKHYQEVNFPSTPEGGSRVEVREFFWYGCPHCYAIEPALEKWVAKLPKSVAFVRTPGTAPSWLFHAKTFYALESLGLGQTLTPKIFEAIHKDKRQINDEKSMGDFLAANGVDRSKFTEALGSFGVSHNVQRAQQYARDYALSSVPTFVVDGKYMTTQQLAGTKEKPGTDEDLFKIVDHLIQKAAKERKAGGRK